MTIPRTFQRPYDTRSQLLEESARIKQGHEDALAGAQEVGRIKLGRLLQNFTAEESAINCRLVTLRQDFNHRADSLRQRLRSLEQAISAENAILLKINGSQHNQGMTP